MLRRLTTSDGFIPRPFFVPGSIIFMHHICSRRFPGVSPQKQKTIPNRQQKYSTDCPGSSRCFILFCLRVVLCDREGCHKHNNPRPHTTTTPSITLIPPSYSPQETCLCHLISAVGNKNDESSNIQASLSVAVLVKHPPTGHLEDSDDLRRTKDDDF